MTTVTRVQARYLQVLAWRAEGATHREIGRRLGVSLQRARDLAQQAQRWQERAGAGPTTRSSSRAVMPEMPLDALPISAQAKRSLWRAGWRTVGEVTRLSDTALLSRRDIGVGTVAALRAAVAAPDEDDGTERA